MNGRESNSLSDKIEDKISVCRDRNVKLSVIERTSSRVYLYNAGQEIIYLVALKMLKPILRQDDRSDG